MLEKELPFAKLKQYQENLEKNISLMKKCDAKVSHEIFPDTWQNQNDLMKAANSYPTSR